MTASPGGCATVAHEFPVEVREFDQAQVSYVRSLMKHCLARPRPQPGWTPTAPGAQFPPPVPVLDDPSPKSGSHGAARASTVVPCRKVRRTFAAGGASFDGGLPVIARLSEHAKMTNSRPAVISLSASRQRSTGAGAHHLPLSRHPGYVARRGNSGEGEPHGTVRPTIRGTQFPRSVGGLRAATLRARTAAHPGSSASLARLPGHFRRRYIRSRKEPLPADSRDAASAQTPGYESRRRPLSLRPAPSDAEASPGGTGSN